MCLLLMIISGIYLYHIHPEVVKSNQKIALIGTVVAINLILNTVALKFFHVIGSAFNLLVKSMGLDVSILPNGIYILNFTDGSYSKYIKIMKTE